MCLVNLELKEFSDNVIHLKAVEENTISKLELLQDYNIIKAIEEKTQHIIKPTFGIDFDFRNTQIIMNLKPDVKIS